MNDMAQRLDMLNEQHADIGGAEPLSELEAFAQLDPTLAGLNKEYLEAKDYRQELVRLNGADDPMAEVAADMEDSNWCAMQTRYLELRERREMMAQAQRLMRASEEKIEKEIEERKTAQSMRFLEWAKSIERIRKAQKSDPILEWACALMILFPGSILPRMSLRQQFAV
jgi:hypothetical protein